MLIILVFLRRPVDQRHCSLIMNLRSDGVETCLAHNWTLILTRSLLTFHKS